MTDLISVLITTHNYGHFIEQAIDSVLAQDFPADQLEILVVDDGSTDDTRERVQRYGSRVEYRYKPNGGQASALNFGFANAHGDIVALLDADDMFVQGKLSRIADAFRSDPALGMVYHPFEEWNAQFDAHRNSNFYLVSGDINSAPEEFFFYIPHPTSCISFRKSLVAKLLPIPEHIKMLADGYPVDLIAFIAPIRAIPEPLAIYRIHGGNNYYADEANLPADVRKTRFEKQQILFKAMREWLRDNGYDRKQRSTRSFLDRWELYQESYEFPLRAPGRLKFFLHLMKYNFRYRKRITLRLLVLNYFNAFASLITGYSRYPFFAGRRANKTSASLLGE